MIAETNLKTKFKILCKLISTIVLPHLSPISEEFNDITNADDCLISYYFLYSSP